MREPLHISFRLPFDDAIAWGKARTATLPEVYYDLLPKQARSHAFTVSGLAGLDQIQGVLDSLNAKMLTGQTFAQWKAGLTPDVLALGKHRLDTIYRNAIQTNYNIGRTQQQRANAKHRPYWMWDAINDGRTRPTHAAMDNYIAPIDDPIWQRWSPPAGHRCRCKRISLTETQAKQRQTIDKARIAENPSLAKARLQALHQGPDEGWGYEKADGQGLALKRITSTKLGKVADTLLKPYATTQRAAPQVVDALASVTDAIARPKANQPTWKDLGRPDLRDVPESSRLIQPALIEAAATREQAKDVLAEALGVSADNPLRVIQTPVESTLIGYAWLDHMVAKEADARERYANFIIPALIEPYEVWAVDYDDDGIRNRYIGLFKGNRDLMVVVRVNLDGSLMWNIMQSSDKKMNDHRIGKLIYSE